MFEQDLFLHPPIGLKFKFQDFLKVVNDRLYFIKALKAFTFLPVGAIDCTNHQVILANYFGLMELGKHTCQQFIELIFMGNQ